MLDGEILVWPASSEQPAPIAQLQRRLGRKAPGKTLLAECPAAFVAYDLLEQGGRRLAPTAPEPAPHRPGGADPAGAGGDTHPCSRAPAPLPPSGSQRLAAAGAPAPAGRRRQRRGADAEGPRLALPGRTQAGSLVETQARSLQPVCGVALCPGRRRPPRQPVHRLHLRAVGSAPRRWRRPGTAGELRQGLFGPEQRGDHGPGPLDPQPHHRAVWAGAGRAAVAGV